MKATKYESKPVGQLALLILVVLFANSGCSLCCSPYVDDYSTFGSRTPRHDMKHGRVGSAFSDSQAMNTSNETTSTESEHFEYLPEEEIIEEGQSVEIGSRE